MLSLCYTCFAKGSGKQFKVPTRWSSAGRLHLIGTLSLFGTTEQLEARELTGSCTQAQVISYLNTLAQRCHPTRLTVVVLDNAPFRKSKLLQEQRATWEAQGLYLRYLPAYCLLSPTQPHRKQLAQAQRLPYAKALLQLPHPT
jgi:putative transposase